MGRFIDTDGNGRKVSDPKFKTTRGKLTAYAFACGYVESKDVDDNNRLTLKREAGTSVYNMCGFVNGEHVYEYAGSNPREARKAFNAKVREFPNNKNGGIL